MLKCAEYRNDYIIFWFTVTKINQFDFNAIIASLRCKNIGKMLSRNTKLQYHPPRHCHNKFQHQADSNEFHKIFEMTKKILQMLRKFTPMTTSFMSKFCFQSAVTEFPTV